MLNKIGYDRHMHDQLHIAKKESQFLFVNPFTISRAGFSTPKFFFTHSTYAFAPFIYMSTNVIL